MILLDGSIKLPAYIKQKKFGKNMITHMIIPETDVSIKQSPKGDIVAIDPSGVQIYIKHKRAQFKDNEQYILTTDTVPNLDDILQGVQKLKWMRHPNENLLAEQIRESWHNGILLKKESQDEQGLRTPQLGAIHAALAHWTTSTDIATIVMPTGTGKTETMLSLLIAAQCERLIVTVPSDSLRGQLSQKFCTLGLLKAFGIVLPTVEQPILGILHERFKTGDELREFIIGCNVIITTMSCVSGYSDIMQKCISDLCSHYFIDEAHHTTASTWTEFIQRFSNSRVLQFTATPFRNDGAKLNGEIIYNYPLRMAQEEHYFTNISFSPIFEINSEKSDIEIANAAIVILKQQEAAGYIKQIVMARCENKKRAREVFEIYKQLSPEYNPVMIFSGSGLSEQSRRESIENLKKGISKVVVCVDMLGEGFDLPTLKVAALHDVKKSLTVTLQLIGRFTRTKFDEDLGDATFVANIADISVSQELERLYAQDADWNGLLPEMSTDAIAQEIGFGDFLKGFNIPSDLKIPLQNIRPALSTVIYRNPKNAWHYEQYQRAIELKEGDKAWSILNREENVLLVIIARRQPVDWGNVQEVENLIWDLLIVINDIDNKLLYINSSDNKGMYATLAEAVIGEKTSLIRSSEPFKSFYGINRVRLQNVGLKQVVGKNIRFRMSVGSDVAEALSIAEKSSGQKAFIVGSGYENGNKVTLGCSYKGRVWTLLTGNIHSLVNWCKSIGTKVVNPNIDGDEILKEALVPKLVTQIPNKSCVWIDWNEDLYNSSENKIEFHVNGYQCDLGNTSIDLDFEKSSSESIIFNLSFNLPNDDLRCQFIMTIGEKDDIAFSHYALQEGMPAVTVHVGRKDFSIEEFFQLYEPSIWFIDGSYLCGNEYIELKQAPGVYPVERINAWDWSGVDISKESQRVGTLRTESIQYNVIQKLMGMDEDYNIIYDDDNSGEIADIITLKEKDDCIHVEMYHLKFAKGGVVSRQVDNLYEVCGQAQKSVHWKYKENREFFRHLFKRETKTYKGQSGSRIIKGSIQELQRLDNLSRRKLPLKFNILIVQPGLSVNSITLEQRTLLAVTEQYLMDVSNIPLCVIANKD